LTNRVLTIAGISFDLLPEFTDCPYSLATAYQPFCSDKSNHHGRISGRYRIIRPDTPRLPALSEPPFWANEIWRMGHVDNGIGIEIYDVIRSRWVPVVYMKPDFSEGTIQPFYGRRADPAPHALNYPYDQAVLINRLLHEHVAVIHGAGIVVDGKGYVFFGPSGIGKTTISRLWVKRGAQLLNDDRVAVYQAADGWRVAGTPWHGEEPVVSPHSAPLAGIVRLRQSPDNHVRPLSAIEALTEVLSCALLPFFSKPGMEQALSLLENMHDSVAMVELSLRPEDASLTYFLGQMK